MTGALPDWLNPSPWLKIPTAADQAMVRGALGAEDPGLRELAILLSPAAGRELEALAQRALAITRRHFGRTINLYAPLYLSNYCPSGCTYCGFAANRSTARYKLGSEELEAELEAMKRMGMEEILLLTGERTKTADYAFVRQAVARAAELFQNVTVEVFPMTEEEYRGLAEAGCTSVTIYQETYHPERYRELHQWGPKRDFTWRLETPARALAGGMRQVGLGALLGLSDPVFDMLCLYRHARHLQRTFLHGGVSISFPRVQPQEGGYSPEFPVDERLLAQIIFAFRICLPDVPLTLSTRENARFRDGMAGVGITKMSAGSRTTVGGYGPGAVSSGAQFDVSDERDVTAFCHMLRGKGLQPVFKNWEAVYRDAAAAARSGASR